MFGDWGDLAFVLFHTCYMFIYHVSKRSTCFTNVLFTTQGAFNQIDYIADLKNFVVILIFIR